MYEGTYMKDQDSIFFRNFSLLLGFLVLLTIVLAVVGSMRHDSVLGEDKMAQDRSDIAKLIEPVAQVNTGDVVEVVEVEEAPAIAFDGSTDGEMIYQNVCFACHGTGAAGAPKLEAADWAGRLEKGTDALVESSIAGLGAMPPKGGRTDLSDEQMKVTVEFMVNGL